MTTLQVQHLLAYLGYDPGPLDGDLGAKTKAAVYDFQKDFTGLQVDGLPGDETQKALRHAVAYGMPDKPNTSGTPPDGGTGTFWDGIKYFKREEFRCQCGRCGGFPVEPEEDLVRTLDQIREMLGVPIIINSGIRCTTHNANVGGVANSQHLYGRAADLHANASPGTMKADAEAVMGATGGIGLYDWGIHVDTGDYSRWDG